MSKILDFLLQFWQVHDQKGFPLLLALSFKMPTRISLKLYLKKSNSEVLSFLKWKYKVLIHSSYHNYKGYQVGSYIYLILYSLQCTSNCISFLYLLSYSNKKIYETPDLVHSLCISSRIIKWIVIIIFIWNYSTWKGSELWFSPNLGEGIEFSHHPRQKTLLSSLFLSRSRSLPLYIFSTKFRAFFSNKF